MGLLCIECSATFSSRRDLQLHQSTAHEFCLAGDDSESETEYHHHPLCSAVAEAALQHDDEKQSVAPGPYRASNFTESMQQPSSIPCTDAPRIVSADKSMTHEAHLRSTRVNVQPPRVLLRPRTNEPLTAMGPQKGVVLIKLGSDNAADGHQDAAAAAAAAAMAALKGLRVAIPQRHACQPQDLPTSGSKAQKNDMLPSPLPGQQQRPVDAATGTNPNGNWHAAMYAPKLMEEGTQQQKKNRPVIPGTERTTAAGAGRPEATAAGGASARNKGSRVKSNSAGPKIVHGQNRVVGDSVCSHASAARPDHGRRTLARRPELGVTGAQRQVAATASATACNGKGVNGSTTGSSGRQPRQQQQHKTSALSFFTCPACSRHFYSYKALAGHAQVEHPGVQLPPRDAVQGSSILVMLSAGKQQGSQEGGSGADLASRTSGVG